MFLPGPLVYYGVINLGDDVIRLLSIAGLLGPFLSGFIMTAVTEGWPGIARLVRRMVCWRVRIRWYVFALVGLPATMVLATLIRPGAAESFDISARPFFLDYLRAFISMVLLGGPLFEEPGWTGFAQPRLQRLCGPLIGGLILGCLWALWHLPGFFHSPIVLGSYANLAIAGPALTLVLIAATRGRMGYREEAETVFDQAAAAL